MAANLNGLTQADTDTLSRVHVPTLVLHGANDPLIAPKNAARFAAAIPGARMIVYPQVGHLPQLEIAQRSARDAAAFLHGCVIIGRCDGTISAMPSAPARPPR